MTASVLFLCTGNSCRSQMAEGWLRHLSEGRIHAASAGIEAHGKNPRAIAVMQEAGIDISQQSSTVVSDDMLARASMIVTVCGHADEHCPPLPAHCVKVHMPFDDPAKAQGTDDEIMHAFRRVRDEIKQSVQGLITQLNNAS